MSDAPNRLITAIVMWTAHLAIWVAVFLLLSPVPLGLGLFNVPSLDDGEAAIFLIYSFGFNMAMIYGYAHFFLPVYQLRGRLGYLLLVNTAFIGVFAGIESVVDHEFTERFGANKADNFWLILRYNLVSNVVMMTVANLYGFTYAWFRDRQAQQQLAQEKLKAELAALRHQIHPHFLFNVLNALYGLALREKDQPTAEGIARLSGMMRYMLYESNIPAVPLERELAYLRDYVDLQRLRLPAAVEVTFDIQGNPTGKRLPPLILAPFIENAFKHGVSTVRPSFIRLQCIITASSLEMVVENSLHQRQSASPGEPGGIGLENVIRRLDLTFPGKYKLSQDSGGDVYLVRLIVPLL